MDVFVWTLLCPSLTVSMCVSVQERHGDLEETVAETDPRAGGNADRGSKTIQTQALFSL